MRPRSHTEPVRLSYTLRGPELAVAIPEDDLEVLVNVASDCSRFWNGPGTLLLPVTDDGEFEEGWLRSVEVLRPDHVYGHPSLPETTEVKLANRWPGRVGRWGDHVREREVGVLRLLAREEAREPLAVPDTRQSEVEALVVTAWGSLAAGSDLWTELSDRFELKLADRDATAHALVEGQLRRRSPLAWAARGTDFVSALNSPSQRIVFVFSEPPTYSELLLFWNLRARSPTHRGECRVLGVPVTALEQPPVRELLYEWVGQPPRGTKPDLRVDVTTDLVDRAKAALSAAGFTHVDTGRETTYAQVPSDRERPEFTLRRGFLPMKLRRGFSAQALVNLREGTNDLDLVAPDRFPDSLLWAGLLRLELRDVPVALPWVDALAQRCLNNGFATEGGVAVAVTLPERRIGLELRLPPVDLQLEAYLASLGLRARPSGAAGIASPLLGRLQGREALDALADPAALPLLQALLPQSRKKLAQRVRRELEKLDPPQAVDEERLVELLRDHGLFFELQARTLNEIQSASGLGRLALLQALGPLTEHGYVVRGRRVDCPRCGFGEFWSLRELDEQLTCRFCLQVFALPSVQGDQEAQTAYRLDGLMARAMDQDLVPVLLALRHLMSRPEASPALVWWPGLELLEPSGEEPVAEIDLLIADGGRLRAVECKLPAEGLSGEEARDHVEWCQRLGAEPVFAAATGGFNDEVTALFDEVDMLLLEPGTLFG